MNREDIIRMAREAGLVKVEDCCGVPNKFCASDEWKGNLAVFANLVASAAQAKEREACAKIVEESSLPDAYSEPVLLDIADDIRARGNNK